MKAGETRGGGVLLTALLAVLSGPDAALGLDAAGCLPTPERCVEAAPDIACRLTLAFHRGDLAAAEGLARRLAWSATEPATVACAGEALGNARYYLGDAEGSGAAFQGSLAVLLRHGTPSGVAYRWKDLGVALRAQGRFEEALRAFEASRAANPAWSTSPLAASLLGNLGDLWWRLGSTDLALDAYLEALAAAESEDPPSQTYDSLARIGMLHTARGAADRAEPFLIESVEGARAQELGREESWILGELAMIQANRGDLEAAEASLARSLALARAHQDPLNEIAGLIELGTVVAERDLQEAETYYRRALVIGEDPAAAPLVWRARAGLAEVALARGDLDRAVTGFELATAGTEAARRRLLAVQDRNALGGRSRRVADGWIEAHLRRGTPRDERAAFRVAEEGRGRALLEELIAARIDPGTDLPLGLAERHRSLSERRGQILDHLTQGSLGPEDRLDLEALELALDEVIAAARQRTGASLLTPEPPTPELLTQRLGPGTAYLGLWIGRREGAGFVVSEGGLDTWRIPAGHLEIERRIDIWLETRRRGEARGETRLRELLLGPLASRPLWADLIVVAADGPARKIPFQALWPPSLGGPSTAHVPSASVLLALLERGGPELRTPPDLLVIGDPSVLAGSSSRARLLAASTAEGLDLAPLPGSRHEAEEVVRRGGRRSRLLLADDATETALHEARPERFDGLHFATHALISPSVAARSGLLLSPTVAEDGILQAREVAHLRLRADLVVLAACRTAQARGEAAVHGLASAFLLAGARTTIASLWDVEDHTTALLFRRFYDLLADGSGKADALAGALDHVEFRLGPAARRRADAFILVGEPFGRFPVRSLEEDGGRGAGPWLLGLGLVLGALSIRRPGRLGQ